MKNSNDTIGNRTRDLPTCSAVPPPAAPSRASQVTQKMYKILGKMIATMSSIKRN